MHSCLVTSVVHRHLSCVLCIASDDRHQVERISLSFLSFFPSSSLLFSFLSCFCFSLFSLFSFSFYFYFLFYFSFSFSLALVLVHSLSLHSSLLTTKHCVKEPINQQTSRRSNVIWRTEAAQHQLLNSQHPPTNMHGMLSRV